MAAAAAAFVFLQFIPQDEALANPAVVREPLWDSPETCALAKRACFDCHSNETEWPWYARVQPMTMLLEQDIEAGRSLMNFSDWKDVTFINADLIEKKLRSGEMPLPKYVLLHPEAKLSDAEIDALVTGLARTFAATQDSLAGTTANQNNAN
jgi:hypothetical protein